MKEETRTVRIEVPSDLELSDEELQKLASEFTSSIIDEAELKPAAVEIEVQAKKKEKEKIQPVIVKEKEMPIPVAKVKQEVA